MKSKPEIYVITYHEFNHVNPLTSRPLDPRFLNNDGFTYYLIDKEVPEVLKDKPSILEYQLNKDVYEAGGKYFGEWSFLLNEEKLGFCKYPLFMISSRFYEKNSWLMTDLNAEGELLFNYLQQYGWGYLPSYDRPLRWINLSWQKEIEKEAWRYKFFPFTGKTYSLINDVFGVRMPEEYQYSADFFCNYIGFRSRAELLEYVAFYRPLIDYFFDSSYRPKRDFSPYIKKTGSFRNEKSFTFLLELVSHLFFWKKKKEYFALHYDGYYSIDESSKKMKCIKKIPIPLFKRSKWFLNWQWRRLNSEGFLAPIKAYLRS